MPAPDTTTTDTTAAPDTTTQEPNAAPQEPQGGDQNKPKANATADDDEDDADASKPKGEEADKPTTQKRKAADGDDVELDEKSMVTMPFTSFQKRLNRAAKSMMREVFGTDNVDELKKIMKEGKSAHEKIEKQRKEQMSEVERVKEEAAELKARAERAEAELERYEMDKEASKGEQLVTSIANKHISNDYVEDAVAVYQRYLNKLDEEELGALDEKSVEQWFKEYSEKKPALARKPGERRKVVEPANTGPDPKKKPDPTKTPQAGKTAKPGQPNSMSKAEWEDYKRAKGINY
jgi:hypothetical protein